MTEYNPPIEKRSDSELLEIVSNEEGWMKDAVNKAKQLLRIRLFLLIVILLIILYFILF